MPLEVRSLNERDGMASASDFLIEPPAQARRGASNADAAVVDGMSGAIGEGKWATDKVVYKTAGEAGNAAQVYRRALSAKLGVEIHTIKSRVWGSKGSDIITDKTKPGDWRFALSLDPNRTKRERKPAEVAAA